MCPQLEDQPPGHTGQIPNQPRPPISQICLPQSRHHQSRPASNACFLIKHIVAKYQASLKGQAANFQARLTIYSGKPGSITSSIEESRTLVERTDLHLEKGHLYTALSCHFSVYVIWNNNCVCGKKSADKKYSENFIIPESFVIPVAVVFL